MKITGPFLRPRGLCGWVLLVLFLNGGSLAQSAPSHSAVTPVPREGRPHERYLSIQEKVRANQGKVELVFVGDSITQGWEGNGREVWREYYGDRKALNLGIGGDRTQHVLWRLENGHLDGIQPRVAVVMIGTNNSGENRNSAGEIVDGVTAVVEKLRAKVPGLKILLLDIFPRGAHFNDQRGQILQVNQTVRKLHDGDHVHYLAIGHHFLEPDGSISKDIMPDYLHLSKKGYEIWAARIEPTLARLLGETPKTQHALQGVWAWSMEGPEERMVEAPMTLRVKDGKLTGFFLMNGDRRLDIEDGWADEKEFHFKIRRDRPNGGVMVYDMSGKVVGDKIEGRAQTVLNGEERNQTWTAVRRE